MIFEKVFYDIWGGILQICFCLPSVSRLYTQLDLGDNPLQLPLSIQSSQPFPPFGWFLALDLLLHIICPRQEGFFPGRGCQIQGFLEVVESQGGIITSFQSAQFFGLYCQPGEPASRGCILYDCGGYSLLYKYKQNTNRDGSSIATRNEIDGIQCYFC